MTLTVSFEISDRDLKRFRAEMRRARQSVRDADENDILEAAEATLAELERENLPDFIAQRIPQLEALLAMLRDEDWKVTKGGRDKVLAVLVYFSDPDDLIPDLIPGLGLIDDAVMIELVIRDLKHDLEAYLDFCHYRETYFKRHKIGRDAVTRAKRLKAKRADLEARATRRRQRVHRARIV